MENIENRIFGKNTCTMKSIAEHVKKHNINMAPEEIVRLADIITEGKEGIHVYQTSLGNLRTLVIRGSVKKDGKEYGIIRTMWAGGAGANSDRAGLQVINYDPDDNFPLTCEKHGTFPYAHGWCPICE